MKLDPEDFTIWRDNPITQLVFKALEAKSTEAKASWVAASWDGGDLRSELLADLRASAQAWDYVRSIDVAELEEILGKD